MKILALLTLIFFAQQPTKLPEGNGIPKGETSQVSQQPDGRERNDNASNSTLGIANGTKPNEQAAPADQDVDIQRTLTNYTGLLVLVGVITAWAIIWQSWHTRRAADAANRNIEATMDERRARVEIIAGPLKLSDSAINGIAIRLKNIGPTIATIIDVAVRLISAPTPICPDYEQCMQLGFTGSILPNSGTDNYVIAILEPQALLSKAEIVKILERPSAIHLYGYARYSDVYNRVHRVQIHLQWWIHAGLVITTEQGQKPAMEYWLKTGDPADNSDNEEKPQRKSWFKRFEERLDALSEPN